MTRKVLHSRAHVLPGSRPSRPTKSQRLELANLLESPPCQLPRGPNLPESRHPASPQSRDPNLTPPVAVALTLRNGCHRNTPGVPGSTPEEGRPHPGPHGAFQGRFCGTRTRAFNTYIIAYTSGTRFVLCSFEPRAKGRRISDAYPRQAQKYFLLGNTLQKGHRRQIM
jgi:hypothetical protein